VIFEFIDHGMMPEKRKQRTWILNDLLIKRGYSLEDLDKMETDEYDFLLQLTLEQSNKQAPVPFGGL
jgi:hypothetical protein